jgi:hypothetical protein
MNLWFAVAAESRLCATRVWIAFDAQRSDRAGIVLAIAALW